MSPKVEATCRNEQSISDELAAHRQVQVNHNKAHTEFSNRKVPITDITDSTLGEEWKEWETNQDENFKFFKEIEQKNIGNQ